MLETFHHGPTAPSVCAETMSRRTGLPTTHWSAVLEGGGADPGPRMAALERLCQTYWYPLYTYIRRRGHGPEDAEDLTQEFFARLVEKRWLEGVEKNGLRFRSFLLHTLNAFLSNHYDWMRAAKRGGGVQRLSLDLAHAEHCYAQELAVNETPEHHFDRRWALATLARALRQLEEEAEAAGKGRQFELLSVFLSREAQPGEYAAVAKALGVSAGAVGVSVHRLRERYRQCVRTQIADTVSDPSLVEEEWAAVFAALRG